MLIAWDKASGKKTDEFAAFRAMRVCPLAAIDPIAQSIFAGVMHAHDGMGGMAYYPQRFARSPIDEPFWYAQCVEEILREEGRLRAKKKPKDTTDGENNE